MFKPNKAEVQSGIDRVEHAEGLIQQLPADHDGRNTWLLNFGQSDEAKALRVDHNVNWIRETQSAQTVLTWMIMEADVPAAYTANAAVKMRNRRSAASAISPRRIQSFTRS